jgi:hypothetical protein
MACRSQREEPMSGVQDNPPQIIDREQTKRLERARAAAREFCRHFGFTKHYVDQLKGNPIQKPLVIERESAKVEVFRWLGHGRGAPYVQVELCMERDEITVYGGFNHREFGPWKKL